MFFVGRNNLKVYFAIKIEIEDTEIQEKQLFELIALSIRRRTAINFPLSIFH